MEVMCFDRENKQKDYQYMARSLGTNKLISGYIAVEKPWYTMEDQWKYYIITNKYGSGGFCGGATDLGFEKTLVDSSTIETYTQIAKIKLNQDSGIDTRLTDGYALFSKDEKEIITIKVGDRIPYELWE